MAQRWIATDFGGLDVFEQVDDEVPAPGTGEATIEVRAAGMNPADFKHVARGDDRSLLPVPVGYEVSGVISALGPDTQIASGAGAVGDAVLAFRVAGGYASALTVAAKDVFAKPENLSFAEAANLLLVGTTAAEMLHVCGVSRGDTILVHGASGSVGVSVLQQAKLIGARVIGTASESNFETVATFGGEPVSYGDGLEARVRLAAPDGVVAALDCVGTDEAVDVSLALVSDRQRIVSIAAFSRAKDDGFRIIAGAMPASTAFRDEARARIIHMAAAGDLVVPMARTFPLADATTALDFLRGQHPGGKLALIPEH
ncbi:NADP-dependent oxidoreductase [Cryobacterium psychrophilum]|uniref:NADP-dependent oxidoreductase n=1 Tax=Cryobacterium psychrophilum TaxID=41988 RepID=A0A4Y8KKY3_9MICO|nr:NADP-dependent oxidoreductase [Cryobacterium psychrophilum]TFD77476.1 NADP-dependent oxidoreductase [Cryobacterium psychrophilum]